MQIDVSWRILTRDEAVKGLLVIMIDYFPILHRKLVNGKKIKMRT